MKLENFFEKFDQFADAPNAIPAMRELVLQLAVRGNLTDRIGSESSKAQLALAEAFRIRRAKREAPDAEDVPFPIPDNWGWVAVGDSMDMLNGRAFKPDEWSTEGTPIIRIQNLNNEHAAFNRCKADLDPKIHVHTGDFLISWSGTPGTSFGAFIWNRGFAYLNQHIFRCELVKGVFEKAFLRLAINARLDEMISHAHGAVGLRHITKGKLESIRLPLPPLAEQKRIVAKVDELMALCDRLEAQQQERETRHASLARASLARFADAPTPANLPFLFHPSYAIPPADLRKSILTLAVQGKLLPQDPNDEPAVTAIEQIASLNGSGRTAKLFAEDELTELQFAVPSSWKWVRFGDLVRIRTGKLDASAAVEGGAYPFFTCSKTPSKIATYSFDTSAVILAGNGDFNLKSYSGKFDAYQRTYVIEPLGWELGFCFWLISAQIKRITDKQRGSAIPYLRLGDIADPLVPFPPLAEQRRIVAKVEQLMALVDALETQLAASRATGASLLSALVAELTGNPDSARGLTENASRKAPRQQAVHKQP